MKTFFCIVAAINQSFKGRTGALEVLLITLLLCFPDRVPKGAPINLFGSNAVSIDMEVSVGANHNSLKLLTDNNENTSATLTGNAQTPIEIVYYFGGAVVSPEKLIIQLSNTRLKAKEVGEIEILVSVLSPTSGFQLLRTEAIRNRKAPQSVLFPITAAKWMMIRITPSIGADKLSITELKVFGEIGEPKSKYAFKESPANSLEVLSRLGKTVDMELSADEASLFADAEDGELNQWRFADAALIASGVNAKVKRDLFLQQIDALETQASKAISKASTAFEKGQKLLSWLHRGPLNQGYVENQTDLYSRL